MLHTDAQLSLKFMDVNEQAIKVLLYDCVALNKQCNTKYRGTC